MRSIERTSPTGPAPTIKTGKIESSLLIFFFNSDKGLLCKCVKEQALILEAMLDSPLNLLVKPKTPIGM